MAGVANASESAAVVAGAFSETALPFVRAVFDLFCLATGLPDVVPFFEAAVFSAGVAIYGLRPVRASIPTVIQSPLSNEDGINLDQRTLG